MPVKEILIADDDQGVIDILREMLRAEGYRVHAASNGQEALDRLKDHHIDLAILDVRMPVLDGLEALKQIRRTAPSTIVMMMTGYGDIDALRQTIIDYGAYDYILKPLRREELIKAVENAFLKHGWNAERERIKKESEHRMSQLEEEFQRRTYQLRESQIKYRQIVENASDAIIVAQDGKLKFVNHKTLELTGYTEEEILEKPFIEVVHPEDRATVEERHWRRLKGEDIPSTYPFRILKKDGESLWVEISAIRTEWEGRPATLNFLRDITERKRAEEALKASEKRYSDLIENFPDIIYVLDPEGRITFVGGAVEALLGYRPQELVGRHFTSLICPEDIDKARYHFNERRTGRRSTRRLELRLATKEGRSKKPFDIRYLTVELYAFGMYDRPVSQTGKKFLGTYGVARDITAEKEAEKALKRSEEHYRTLVENIPVAVYRTTAGPEGRFLMANPAFLKMFGFSSFEELKVVRVSTLYENPQQRKSFSDRLIMEKSVADVELRLRKRDGTPIWASVTARIGYQGEGDEPHFDCMMIDITQQKKAEQAFRESEEKYRTLFEAAGDAIFLARIEGEELYFVDCNPAALEMFGCRRDQILGKTPLDFSPPFQADGTPSARKVVEKIRSALKGRPQFFEYRHKRLNGEVFETEVNLKKLEISGTGYMQGIVRDITERKRVEDTLRVQKEYLSALHETTLHLISRLELGDLLNAIIERSSTLVRAPYGFIYTLNEARDRMVLQGGTGIFKDYIGYRIKPGEGLSGRVWQTGQIMAVDNYRSWSGRVRDDRFNILHFMVAIPLKSDSGIVGVIGLAYDKEGERLGEDEMAILIQFAELASIAVNNAQLYSAVNRELAERKRAEEALRESEMRYRALVENAPLGILSADTEGRIIEANPMLIKILGSPSIEATKQINMLTFPLLIEAGISEDFRRCMQTGESSLHERSYKSKWGKEVFLRYHLSALRGLDGRITGVQAIVEDISEQKKLEAQLQQAQKLEAVGTLAGGIAHDFNNLLTGIQGYVSLMMLELDPGHPHYQKLRAIEKNVQSGASLTNQLLGYARKGRYEVKPIDLNRLVRETSETFGRTRKEISIHLDLSEDLFPIEADQGQIEQVLLNLYVNASDAMPGGGDLTIKTQNTVHKRMKGKLYDPKPGDYVMLMVSDTGIGMDQETMKRIFDPFFTTKEMGRGTGLGLASTYGIIKGHGGYIDVESSPGMGSTFRIYLPASKQKVSGTKRSPEHILNGTETILLVDDEAMILDVGKNLLIALGYNVLTAKGGREALRIYETRKEEINMVVLDLVMPGMGGRETFERLKEIDPDVRVLLSSGYSLDGQASEIIKRGCEAFIQKPYNLKELSKKVRAVLDKR